MDWWKDIFVIEGSLNLSFKNSMPLLLARHEINRLIQRGKWALES